MNGILYAVGVGPGDPELLTLKAARILAAADVLAGPEKAGEPGAAFRIAEQAVPETREKPRLLLSFPMKRDAGLLAKAHRQAAESIEAELARGRSVALLTLGDPAVYATAAYLLDRLRQDGYAVETVSGVPSFCAAAARLGIPLALGDEPFRVVPADSVELSEPGTVVVMKAGKRLRRLKELAAAAGRRLYFAENCGLPGERAASDPADIPDEAGYFSLVIIR